MAETTHSGVPAGDSTAWAARVKCLGWRVAVIAVVQA
jgi:hypothetical protein